jgi:hypothetical protein
MANQGVTIGATLKFDTNDAVKNVGNIKKELRDANKELINARQEFGDFSNEALTAAKKVAGLKDQIGDARNLVDTMNPDRKFQAFGQAVQGVTGGFTALTGIMGLFGAEGKEVEAMLLKVQSALAISQGLDDIRESIDGFKNLGAQIKNTSIFKKADVLVTKAAAAAQKLFGMEVEATSISFKVLKGAIAATGIGLLLVLIGELVPKIMDWVSGSKDAEAAQEALNEALEKQADLMKEEEKSIDQVTARRVALAKLAGKSEEEINKIADQGGEDRIALAKANYERLDAISQDGSKRNLKAQTQANKAARDAYLAYTDEVYKVGTEQLEREAALADKARAAEKAKRDKAAAEDKQKLDERNRQRLQDIAAAQALEKQLINEDWVSMAGDAYKQDLEKLRQSFEEKKAILKKGGQDLNELELWYNIEKTKITSKAWEEEQTKWAEEDAARRKREEEQAAEDLQRRQQEVAAQREAAAALVADHEKTLEDRKLTLDIAEKAMLSNSRLTEEQRQQMEEAFTSARISLAKEEAEAKKGFYQDIGGALGALSDLVGKQTIAGKTLAIAQATINTWLGATEVLKTKSVLPEPMATISKIVNVAAIVATGISAIKNIVKVPVAGGGGAAPGISTPSAPLTPIAQNSTTSLDQNSINALGSQTNRAFVLETDVTTNQERVRLTNRRARIGN